MAEAGYDAGHWAGPEHGTRHSAEKKTGRGDGSRDEAKYGTGDGVDYVLTSCPTPCSATFSAQAQP